MEFRNIFLLIMMSLTILFLFAGCGDDEQAAQKTEQANTQADAQAAGGEDSSDDSLREARAEEEKEPEETKTSEKDESTMKNSAQEEKKKSSSKSSSSKTSTTEEEKEPEETQEEQVDEEEELEVEQEELEEEVLEEPEEESIVEQSIVTKTDHSFTPATVHESGWKAPVMLGYNDEGWEDSPYITRDGQEIYFMYHPYKNYFARLTEAVTSILSDPEGATEEGLDGKIYVSRYPFETKEPFRPKGHDVDGPEFECCYYETTTGDEFYSSNLHAWEISNAYPGRLYMNGQRLEFEGDEDQANPHYCEALDELWFDCPADKHICIVENFSTLTFTDDMDRLPAPLAPYPINSDEEGVHDLQPYLTDDCQTLYFTSSRLGSTLSVFRSERVGDSWSEPLLFISHPSGLGEISFTADGNAFIYAQVEASDDPDDPTKVSINQWYSEREE